MSRLARSVKARTDRRALTSGQAGTRAQQNTLPGRYYTDPEIFRREMQTFFYGMWVCAGRSEQLPSARDFFLREVAGESIIITRNTGGAVHAFYNVCRHRGTQLCREAEGRFAGRIQCPYHGWTYGLDGKLLGAPHMDDATFQREDYPLHAVHAEAWEGNIFLNLSHHATPLLEQLADLPQRFAPWKLEELRVYKRHDYEVKANWKLIVLNYNECLHCPILHPLLTRITDT